MQQSVLFSLRVVYDIVYAFLTHALPNNATSQRGNSADARLGLECGEASLAALLKLLNSGHIESDLLGLSCGEADLAVVPNLLLGVQNGLGLALPALKIDTVTSLSGNGWVDELDRTGVVVLHTRCEAGRCGENHGAGLDAAHGDGLEVADCHDLAVLHVLERNEAVEARADGADDLALVLGGVVCAGCVAAVDGADKERVGVRVPLSLENVSNAQVNHGRCERLLDSGSLGRLGLLLLLLLLDARDLGSDSACDLLASLLSLLAGLLGLLLDLLGSRCLSTSSGGLLLLLLLLLGLGVEGLHRRNDLFNVDGDLLTLGNLEAEHGRVLDEVEVTDDVVVSLLAGALLGRPELHDGSQARVHADISDGGLAAEQSGAGREVGVQGREALSSLRRVLSGSSDVGGGDEPLLDLGLLRLGVL